MGLFFLRLVLILSFFILDKKETPHTSSEAKKLRPDKFANDCLWLQMRLFV